MRMAKFVVAASLVVLFSAASVNASELMSDDFNAYALGNLVPQDSWTAHSGAGNGPVQVLPNSACHCGQTPAGNFIQLMPYQSEDVNKPIGATMGAGDKWYAGFCVQVQEDTEHYGGPVTKSDYFAHFLQSTNTFAAKVGVTPPNASGDYTFYLHQGSGSGPGAVWSTDFAYDSCHRIVTSYDYDSGDVEMWVDPIIALGPEGNPSVTVTGVYPGDEITAYAFRQGYNNPAIENCDNLIVADAWADVCCECVPEPSTLALLVLGGLALARRR